MGRLSRVSWTRDVQMLHFLTRTEWRFLYINTYHRHIPHESQSETEKERTEKMGEDNGDVCEQNCVVC